MIIVLISRISTKINRNTISNLYSREEHSGNYLKVILLGGKPGDKEFAQQLSKLMCMVKRNG